MLRGGLSSASYRNSSAQAVITAARSAGLEGIEWSADTHAPVGEPARVESLMISTLRAGLTVSAYGSYYRIGAGGNGVAGFRAVLDCARRLQAPLIRVWGPSASAGVFRFEDFAARAAEVAEAAGRFGITVCLEPHERSVVDRYDILADIVDAVAHPFFKACWTPLPGSEACADGYLDSLARRLSLVHVRNWNDTYERLPLDRDGTTLSRVVGALAEHTRNSPLDHWALIEYLSDETQETLNREAGALKTLLATFR